MTPAAAWVLVVLAAILVGAAVPALLQLRRTLKTADQTLESTGRQVSQTLDRLTITLERFERTAGDLERGVGRVTSLFDTLGGIGDTLAKVRSSVIAVTSIGSVVASALLTAFGFKSGDRRTEPDPQKPLEHGEKA
jgi:uncharacterized protein YoxC